MIKKYSSISFISVLVLLVLNGHLFSQSELKLNIVKALAVQPAELNPRSVSQKNYIEYMIVKNEWISPVAGRKLFDNDTSDCRWYEISPDEHGWYQISNRGAGYAYLEIESEYERSILLAGSAYSMVYVNGEPRIGNVYQYKDKWESWEPDFSFSYLPVKLKQGKNELLFRFNYNTFKVRFFDIKSSVQFNNGDLTLPDILTGQRVDQFGGVVVINNSDSMLSNLAIKSEGDNFETILSDVPVIQPYSVRKVRFNFKSVGFAVKSDQKVTLTLFNRITNKQLDSKTISLRVLNRNETYRQTFISSIDGSVQYYAVNEATGDSNPKALFLSLHGAAVMAENQANSYMSKNWGIIVSPTNRRPYGFNWEDFGRIDALEVLEIAKLKFNIDPERIYLTGHSMGGHGTWHLGGTYPDQFAAIGPSAGWISFWSYRFGDKYSDDNPVINLISRTGNPSDTYKLIDNYNQLGIYIIHGSDDDNVRVEQSKSMVEQLQKSHKDFMFHEEKDAGHWWDKRDETGADCVDWPAMFDFFARHVRSEKHRILHVNFRTANPGISAKNNWATIYRQSEFLKFSDVDLVFEPGLQNISGITSNVSVFSIDSDIFNKSKPLNVKIDGQTIPNIEIKNFPDKIWLQKDNNLWMISTQPDLFEKGPHRYGTFKDAFKNKMVFIYGTSGDSQENNWAFTKARYDAEYFWYQGNGSVEVIADSSYDPDIHSDRNVILYGNSETNSAWQILLKNSPLIVDRESVKIGDREIVGKDLACLFIRPNIDNTGNTIGIVSGTGLEGMKLCNSRPYLSPGFAFPDVTIFSSGILLDENSGYEATGFWGYDWSLDKGEFAFKNLLPGN